MIVTAIYVVAFSVGIGASFFIESVMLRYFVFDVVATVVTYIFSETMKNSSVYDPYWSFTPMVMSIVLFIEMRAFSLWQILSLIVFNVWGARLTVNWITVFTDFSYEDWRYRKFRAENHGFMWFVINFFGIHMVPTLVVFAGMLPIFEMAVNPLGPLSVIGMLVVLTGVGFEFFADRAMHSFLSSAQKGEVCKAGLWNYSRHPNYLGEMTVWVGVFLTMLPYAVEKWFYGIGLVLVIVLFNVVSVPMMEKRQMERRPAYADYKKVTSRVILRPHKK